jgi:hypothetical protein
LNSCRRARRSFGGVRNGSGLPGVPRFLRGGSPSTRRSAPAGDFPQGTRFICPAHGKSSGIQKRSTCLAGASFLPCIDKKTQIRTGPRTAGRRRGNHLPRAFEISQDSIKITTPNGVVIFMEVTPGFEPGNESFADSCLTTWLCHHKSSSLLYANVPKKSTQIF